MNNYYRLITALVGVVALLVGSAISSSALAQQPPRPTLQGLQDQINTLNTRVNNPDPPCADTTNRYVDCGNGTVTDTVTGLIWLKNAYCFGNTTQLYKDAIAAAANLADGNCGLSDHSKPGDWRLPTPGEWQATVHQASVLGCTGSNGPSLTNTPGIACYNAGPQPFPNVTTSYFWSSTSLEDNPSQVHVILLYDSLFYGNPKNGTGGSVYAWPVRGSR
ncbi:MAG: DUF1566 domain-containing protein [Candidatus Competibacteraceae bacterium]